jgi:DNA modification methylase
MSEQLTLSLFDEPAPQDTPQARYEVICQDVMEWARTYTGPKMHACICDPPYHLQEIHHRPPHGTWGFGDPRTEADKAMRREAKAGFMGQRWDGGDIAFKPDTWKALAQHLLPGAFIMAFAGARTYHRLACALEDAGLILHPACGWVNGAGFPKATRIDSQVDAKAPRQHLFASFAAHYTERRKASGFNHHEICARGRFFAEVNHGGASSNWEMAANVPTLEQWQVLQPMLGLSDEFLPLIRRLEAEREVIGQQTKARKTDCGIALPTTGETEYQTWDVTAPATPLAQIWAGHRYGLQALKPAIEFIAVAQKPYQGKPVQSITQTGAGALWIDGGRIGTVRDTPASLSSRPTDGAIYGKLQHGTEQDLNAQMGRWPPNFALCHMPECVRVGERQVQGSHDTTGIWSATPETDGLRGNERGLLYQDGIRRSAKPQKGYTDANGHETVAEYRCAENCPVGALDAQAGERYSASAEYWTRSGKTAMPGSNGSEGSTGYDAIGGASRFFQVSDWSLDIAERLAEADPVRYCAKAASAEREAGLLGHLPCLSANDPDVTHDGDPVHTRRHYRRQTEQPPSIDADGTITYPVQYTACRRNGHPTQKPLTLVQWLATLLLPPAAYAPRRLLIPFSGTASEGIGAMLAGWEEIVMIEQDQSYVDIARQRVAYWQQRRGQR